ncbi:MAG: PSD1 domain-containing protein [Planctomycetaceae bacterium]|nr:PSD1 domain-containing protein [Planctomycetaceae bacterium]
MDRPLQRFVILSVNSFRIRAQSVFWLNGRGRPVCPRLLCVVLLLLSAAAPSRSDESATKKDAANAEAMEFVRTRVQPLLQSRCGECHGGEEVKGGLRLSNLHDILRGGDSGPAVEPGKPDESLLISAVRYESFEMPPRTRMPDAEIELLENWISMGAPWPDSGDDPPHKVAEGERAGFPMQERIESHWVWQPIGDPEIPSLEAFDASLNASEWVRTDIDRFILQALQGRKLKPAGDADRRAILRRLYFDLVGLPPTIDQQQRFYNDPDSDDDAIARVVDELLLSPHFGERWGRHWLDLVRYAETLGHEFDFPLPYAWKYRDYVIRAINADVPFDQFAREHIAGDLLPNPRFNSEHAFNESIIATGFWYLGEDKHAPVDVKGEEAARVDNQLDVFSKAFLGMTVSCARCHDHKFDAITTRDYYALSGFLQSSRRRIEWLDSDGKMHEATDQIATLKRDVHDALAARLKDVTEEQSLQRLAAVLRDAAVSESESPAIKQLLQEAMTATDKRPTDSGADDLDFLYAAIADLQVVKPDSDTPQIQIDRSILATTKSWSRRIAEESARVLNPSGTADAAPDKKESSPVVFADLRNGLPEGWFAYGQAFRSLALSEFRAAHDADLLRVGNSLSPIPSADAIGHGNVATGLQKDDMQPKLSRCQDVTSAATSLNLRGTLQSPTFRLQHPEIQVLVAGRGSRIRLVIDGYVMNEFSELLFRGARQNIETEGELRWIRLNGDVKRYLGHQCHLEFLDESDGWFSVREVRFSERENAPILPVASTNNRSLAAKLAATFESVEVASPDVTKQILGAYTDELRRRSTWPSTALRLGLLHTADQDDLLAKSDAVEQWRSAAASIPAGDPVLVMCEGTGEDEHLFIRGSHKNMGPPVPRHFLTALSTMSETPNHQTPYAESGSGRLRLAEDVLSEDNPLTARVAVNRIWLHLFGRGLVPSADNFGVLGEVPSHPELLDHLATRFRRDGWSMKSLIRYIVTSRVYRQSIQSTEEGRVVDPTNALLHHAHVRRLEAEVIRDAILTVSGRLDPTSYGPPVPVYLTEFMQGRGRPGQSGPLDGNGRRSIYQSVNRNFLSPFLLVFDTPAPATSVGRRGTSNVPAQALIMMNSEFVTEQARVWSARLIQECGVEQALDDPGNKVVPDRSARLLLDRAFRQALARSPEENEVELLVSFANELAPTYNLNPSEVWFHQNALADVCHIILNQKEFLFLD